VNGVCATRDESLPHERPPRTTAHPSDSGAASIKLGGTFARLSGVRARPGDLHGHRQGRRARAGERARPVGAGDRATARGQPLGINPRPAGV
jgi:hypothetical protein